jgi:hypothetical protein
MIFCFQLVDFIMTFNFNEIVLEMFFMVVLLIIIFAIILMARLNCLYQQTLLFIFLFLLNFFYCCRQFYYFLSYIHCFYSSWFCQHYFPVLYYPIFLYRRFNYFNLFISGFQTLCSRQEFDCSYINHYLSQLNFCFTSFLFNWSLFSFLRCHLRWLLLLFYFYSSFNLFLFLFIYQVFDLETHYHCYFLLSKTL